jgi:hypothetical protein
MAAGARPAAMAESSWTLLRASRERQSDGFTGDRSRVRGSKQPRVLLTGRAEAGDGGSSASRHG